MSKVISSSFDSLVSNIPTASMVGNVCLFQLGEEAQTIFITAICGTLIASSKTQQELATNYQRLLKAIDKSKTSLQYKANLKSQLMLKAFSYDDVNIPREQIVRDFLDDEHLLNSVTHMQAKDIAILATAMTGSDEIAQAINSSENPQGIFIDALREAAFKTSKSPQELTANYGKFSKSIDNCNISDEEKSAMKAPYLREMIMKDKAKISSKFVSKALLEDPNLIEYISENYSFTFSSYLDIENISIDTISRETLVNQAITLSFGVQDSSLNNTKRLIDTYGVIINSLDDVLREEYMEKLGSNLLETDDRAKFMSKYKTRLKLIDKSTLPKDINPLECTLCGSIMLLSAIQFGITSSKKLLHFHRELALMKKI